MSELGAGNKKAAIGPKTNANRIRIQVSKFISIPSLIPHPGQVFLTCSVDNSYHFGFSFLNSTLRAFIKYKRAWQLGQTTFFIYLLLL